MKTEVKKLDGNTRELSIEVSGDIVKNKFEDVFTRIGKEAKVPGFRPGHAPREMLEKHYAQAVHEQVLRELLPDVYNQAIEKEAIDSLELPEISEVKLDRDKLIFKAKVEIRPEIPLKDYKGVKVNYKKISVSADEIKRQVDAIKESRKLETIDDAAAKGLGYPNMAELSNAVERQIYLQKENHQRQDVESQIIKNVVDVLDFKLPQSLVKRQLEDLIRQAKLDLALKGMPREKIDEQDKKFSEELEPEAKSQVKVYLVLAEIAKREKITMDDHMPRRTMEFLLKEANWQEEA